MRSCEFAIEARRLSKTFAGQVVLNNIDLAISAGEAVAIIGPNGSGKTTLLRCLASLLRPSSGEVFWFGKAPRTESQARRLVGTIGHESGLYPHLTVRENLLFAARMCDVSEPSRRVAELLAVGGLLWLAIFFAGIIALDRSFAGERENGCLEGLLFYPVSAAAVYVAKLAVNVAALTCLECVLIPLFVVLSGTPLPTYPGSLVSVVLLGNLGIAAVGTLLSALTSGMRHGTGFLAILALPLVVPVLLSAAEATRLTIAGEFGAEWQRWLQLLGAFAVIFVTAGTVLFEFVVQE